MTAQMEGMMELQNCGSSAGLWILDPESSEAFLAAQRRIDLFEAGSTHQEQTQQIGMQRGAAGDWGAWEDEDTVMADVPTADAGSKARGKRRETSESALEDEDTDATRRPNDKQKTLRPFLLRCGRMEVPTNNISLGGVDTPTAGGGRQKQSQPSGRALEDEDTNMARAARRPSDQQTRRIQVSASNVSIGVDTPMAGAGSKARQKQQETSVPLENSEDATTDDDVRHVRQ
jgi:hypothetical protein